MEHYYDPREWDLEPDTLRLHEEGRLRDGVSEVDSWNLKSHLTQVLVVGLNHLANNIHGVPVHYLNGDPEDVDAACDRWCADLRAAADKLAKYQEHEDKGPWTKESYKEVLGLRDEALKFVVENFDSLWD